jgi:hypothetical protein
MGKVLKFKELRGVAPNNLIASKPLEFRFADWGSVHFIQMQRSQSLELERHRKDVYETRDGIICSLPPHFVLSGSMASTIHGLFHFRENEEKMREVYYMAGLIDCMIHQVTPLLRTEAIKEMYTKIRTLKSFLNINWYGSIEQVFLPLDTHWHNESEYRGTLSAASTMKDLYRLIREGTDEMFDILSLEYVFYAPPRRTGL